MLRKLFSIVSITLTFFMLSCKKELPNTGATAAVSMANEWWCELKLDGVDVVDPSGYFSKIFTYNSAANKNELWVDDDRQSTITGDYLWDFKVKATADFSNLTFHADSAVSVVSGYDIKVNITDGKIFPGMGHSKTGNVTDSIYMKVEFEDDPGTMYTIEGHARTRFAEDEY